MGAAGRSFYAAHCIVSYIGQTHTGQLWHVLHCNALHWRSHRNELQALELNACSSEKLIRAVVLRNQSAAAQSGALHNLMQCNSSKYSAYQ